jgi:hypothetical protein
MRQNLHTAKIFLSISAKYRVYYMKMARIFQQCTNCLEKESSVDTVAGLVDRFGTPNILKSKIRHENGDILKKCIK